MTPRPKQPAPRIRPVTRWMVAYANPLDGYNLGASVWLDLESVGAIVMDNAKRGIKCISVRVRITPLQETKAKKGAKR